MQPQSPSKQAAWDLTQFSQLPSASPSHFPESHPWSEISSLWKVISVLGKARSHRAPNLGYRRGESLGWFDVSPKNSAWDMVHEQACCHGEAANHQLPIAVALWITWTVSAEECSSLMQICCSTHSLIWMWWPHSTRAHSMVPATFAVYYSEVLAVHACTFQSTLLRCEVTPMLYKLFSLY